MIERCRTVTEALKTLKTIEELDAFIEAMRDPTLDTMPATREEKLAMAHKRIDFLKASR